MSGRQGPLDFYAPLDEAALPRSRETRPVERPSLLTQFDVAARGSAANDQPLADQARRLHAMNDALASIVAELEARDIRVGEYSHRYARDAWALSYDTDAIWQGIARARAMDTEAFKGVEPTPDAFRRRVVTPVDATIAQERDVQARSSWTPWIAGQLAGGIGDPENLVPIGIAAGRARGVAQAAIQGAIANTQAEAVFQPLRSIEAARGGVDRGIGDVGLDLALAAGTGGLFGGAAHAMLPSGRRRPSPDGALADRVRDAIPPARMTEAERDAVRVLDRHDEMLSTSPFQPGAGGDAHVARLERTIAAMENRTAPIAASPAPAFDFRAYANRTAIVESRGDWDAQAKTSSAFGRYQITRPTWLQYARQALHDTTSTDDALWARRTTSAAQEAVFAALTRDNRTALARIGAPETHGNLYLMHFAGRGGASKILRAAADTPIEDVLNARAIAANPFLKGKSAGEVIAWAHGRMGDTVRDGPVLSREGFEPDDAGDAEWRAAQAEVDATSRALADAERQSAAVAGRPADDDPLPGFDDAFAPPARGADPFDPVVRADDPGDMPDFWRQDLTRLTSPEQAVEWVNARTVHATQAEAALRSAITIHPQWREQLLDGLQGKLRRRDVKYLRDRMNADAAVPAGRDWEPDAAAPAAPGNRFAADALALERAGAGDIPAALSHPEIGTIDVKWGEPGDAAKNWRGGFGLAHILAKHPEIRDQLADLPDLIRGMDVVKDDGRTIRLASATHAAGVRLDWDGDAQRWLVTAYEKGRQTPAAPVSSRDAAVGRASPDRGAEPDMAPDGVRDNPGDAGAMPAPIDGFDHPDDVAAARQIDSLEHDLRMFLEEEGGRGMTVRLSDEGDVMNAADVLDELDLDDAAIDAARACMVPGGEA